MLRLYPHGDIPDNTKNLEELLVILEENERLMESLEVESTAASKGGGEKRRITKVNILLQIQRFNSNQSAHPAEVNTMVHSARKRKQDCRKKPSSGVRNCLVLKDYQGAEISNLIKRQTAEAGDDDSGCYMNHI